MQECPQSRPAADILSSRPAVAAAASRLSATSSCIRADGHGQERSSPREVREGLSARLFVSGHAAELMLQRCGSLKSQIDSRLAGDSHQSFVKAENGAPSLLWETNGPRVECEPNVAAGSF